MLKRKDGNEGWRIPAKELETVVLNEVCRQFESPQMLFKVLNMNSAPAAEFDRVAARVKTLSNELASEVSQIRRRILQSILCRVTLDPNHITIEANLAGILRELQLTGPAPNDEKTVSWEIPN